MTATSVMVEMMLKLFSPAKYQKAQAIVANNMAVMVK
jgi:hypothetical protein